MNINNASGHVVTYCESELDPSDPTNLPGCPETAIEMAIKAEYKRILLELIEKINDPDNEEKSRW